MIIRNGYFPEITGIVFYYLNTEAYNTVILKMKQLSTIISDYMKLHFLRGHLHKQRQLTKMLSVDGEQLFLKYSATFF